MEFPTLRSLRLLGGLDFTQGDADRCEFGQQWATGQHLVDVLLEDIDAHHARIEIDVLGKARAVVVETQVHPALEADRAGTDHGREMPQEHEVEAFDCLSLVHS